MTPTLDDGDIVSIARAGPNIGDIVLAQHPYKQSVTMLKRVANIDENGRFELRGDNPTESTDSRTFGEIPEKDILGEVVGLLNKSDEK